ncbi:MAG TPA: hypothetical protein VEK35_05880, partial [Roseiarcus sp.]|nr:hypothetical protein [Roseiarcus sp.]
GLGLARDPRKGELAREPAASRSPALAFSGFRQSLIPRRVDAILNLPRQPPARLVTFHGRV